ncbi:GNAT family N-acetyltransferase [bacterium]|nr:GNAT family N-acetyltransferase [bacterium]
MCALPDPVAGLTWRHTEVEDVEALAALYGDCFEVDGGYLVVASEIRDDLTHPANDPAKDSVIALDESGTIAAFGFVFRTGGDRSQHRAFPWGEVHPDYRRKGVGTSMMTWMEDRALERFAGIDEGLPQVIRVDAYDTQTDRLSLFEHFGYERARYFIEMISDLSSSLPECPVPDGIEVRDWSDTAQTDALGIHNQAFADHWGSEPMTVEAWEHRFGEFEMPRASFVAYEGDLPVAYISSGMYPHDFETRGRSEAWVEVLGTIRSHRGRGIASALIERAMEEYRRVGMEYAVIGVDADNPTGAVSVYRRLGFVPEKTSVTYMKTVN